MIEFNKVLQKLNNHLNQQRKIHGRFAQMENTELIRLISQLDKEGKGYLTHTQLSINLTSQYLSFLSQIFQPRVSYSILSSYLQNYQHQNNELFSQHIDLKAQHVIQLLYNKYLIDKSIKYVRMHIANYIVSRRQVISYAQFQNYCHQQNLALNPKLIFSILSHPFDQLKLTHNQQSIERSNVRVNETKQKISKLRSTLWRLNQRVNRFGAYWM